MLTQEQVQEVTVLIADAAARAAVKALQEAKVIAEVDHSAHHAWIAARIKSEGARAALLEELTKHVAKWGTIGVLSAIFYGLYLVAMQTLKRGV